MFYANPRNLSGYLRRLRFEQRLSFGDLARRMGATNIGKSASRIADFEYGGDIDPDLLKRVIVALEADPEEVLEYTQRDHDAIKNDFMDWSNQPVAPILIVRLIAAVYRREPVPSKIVSRDEAIQWASEQARQWVRKVCLEWNRRESIWINENGLVYWERVVEPVIPEFLR